MVERIRRLHLLVEGQTEETVAREVLAPYLGERGFWITSSILVTRRPAGSAWNRGGVTSWSRLAGDVRRLLRDSSLDILTTMIDYYGFPVDAPGMADRPDGCAPERVRHVESAIATTVGDPRFVPHLVLHELEAWVFAAADQLASLRGEQARGLRRAGRRRVGMARLQASEYCVGIVRETFAAMVAAATPWGTRSSGSCVEALFLLVSEGASDTSTVRATSGACRGQVVIAPMPRAVAARVRIGVTGHVVPGP